jgi:IPT/TIG domain
MKLSCVLLIALLSLGCGGYNAPGGTNGMGVKAAANISALIPSSAAAGGPGFTLTVNGTNFAANSVVFFAATAMATTVVTSNQLMANIPASAIATAGTVQVYVNSAGNIYGVNSNTVDFMVN